MIDMFNIIGPLQRPLGWFVRTKIPRLVNARDAEPWQIKATARQHYH
jgi:hypothetical protein